MKCEDGTETCNKPALCIMQLHHAEFADELEYLGRLAIIIVLLLFWFISEFQPFTKYSV